MKHKTQAQLASYCRFMAKELSAEAVKQGHGNLADDLLRAAGQLAALAQASHTSMLDRRTVEPYVEMSVELLVEAQMLRVDRTLAKVDNA
jgi:hypothetical protein